MKKIVSLLLMVMCLHTSAKTHNCFSLDTMSNHTIIGPLNIVTNQRLSYKVPSNELINGLSIDGSFTKTGKNYLIRVVLKDVSGKEHLVMESYNEINDERHIDFSNYCEETAFIKNTYADSIIIITQDVECHLDKIHYISNKNRSIGHETFLEDTVQSIRRHQIEQRVRKINAYNFLHNKLWRADVTPLSLVNYEDKKRILGLDDNCCTGGIEYYAEGIFEIGDIDEWERNREVNSSFVESFDWRNRHGKNWITSNKHQGESGFCSAFTAVGVVEALTRLYYNQLIDIDLSEQEAACCNGTKNPWKGMPISAPLTYIQNHGVCDEEAYPFVNDSLESLNCRSSLIVPNELVSIGGYTLVEKTEDELKRAVISHGPLASSVHYWGYKPNGGTWSKNHAMPIVGYGQLHEGDTIYHWIESNGFLDGAYTVSPGDPRIGCTYWIYKNSYGLDHDSARIGYMHFIHYNYMNSMGNTYYCLPSITSMNYSDSDIICSDEDGDGYYNWGIGAKPTFCPSWVPDSPDGDDSDYTKGLMYLGGAYTIGEMEILDPDGHSTLQITGNTTYNTRQFKFRHIRIASNATLKVKNILNLFGRVTITIESGGELIIDGGTITNADISFATGGKLTIKNGGKLVMRTNTDFVAPVGALVEIENGEICKSNDF